MTTTPHTWPEQKAREEREGSTDSREAWVRSLVPHCVSVNDAAKRFGCPQHTLWANAVRLGVAFPKGTRRTPSPIDEAILRTMAEKGVTANQVAVRFGVTRAAAHSFATRRGIALKLEPRGGYIPKRKSPAPKLADHKPGTGLERMAEMAARESAAMRRVGRT